MQMSYYQFITLINCMGRTEGMGEIEKKGGQYMLYVDCTEYGMFVTIYGGSYGFQELVLPLCLCKQLREPGEEAI